MKDDLDERIKAEAVQRIREAASEGARGYIGRYYSVFCANNMSVAVGCHDHLDLEARSMRAAQAEAKRCGWVLTQERGWQCPFCAAIVTTAS